MNTTGRELISYEAPQEIRDALDGIGRTEDVAFSPDNRRLALAGFYSNSIAIVDVDIRIEEDRPHVTVTDMAEFPSTSLHSPHGVIFLDNDTIATGSRGGSVSVFRLPSNGNTELTLCRPPPDRDFALLDAPGSLAIAGGTDGPIEVIVCNNEGNTITRHTLQDDPFAVIRNDVLLSQWLNLPDGVALSPDGRWLAISNHNSHTVMMYERSSALHEGSDPVCILRGAAYPHGVRFTDDGRHLFVAAAGKPFIQVYMAEAGTWRGVQYPTAAVRVMDDEVFDAHPGRSKGEGGPKGIDIDSHGRVLAVTSEYQRLNFFDVATIIDRSVPVARDYAQQVRFELEFQELFREAEAYIVALQASNSFRLTKPLREFKLRFKKQQ